MVYDAGFYQQQSYFSQIVSEKTKILTSFLWKNPKITILFRALVFSFTYLVLVYPTDSTLNTDLRHSA